MFNSSGIKTRSKRGAKATSSYQMNKSSSGKAIVSKTKSISSTNDIVPEVLSSGKTIRVREIIDRRIDECIGIKRMNVFGKSGFPELLPTHIYSWYKHFFELQNLMEAMLKQPSITKWTKFVKCHYERDMYGRPHVHKDIYSSDCSYCRTYIAELEDKAIWWFDDGNGKFIRMSFKRFTDENVSNFQCSILWIKVIGTMELQLKLVNSSEGMSLRRHYRVATGSSLTKSGIEEVTPTNDVETMTMKTGIEATNFVQLTELTVQVTSSMDNTSAENGTVTNGIEEALMTNGIEEATMTNGIEESTVALGIQEATMTNDAEAMDFVQPSKQTIQDTSSVNTTAGSSVPEYESSPESTNATPAKRVKVDKNWAKNRDFENSRDAEDFIKKEGCWSTYTHKSTEQGEKFFYRCNKSKLRGKQCDSGAYLLYDSRTPKVTLFMSSNAHSCDKDGNAANKVPMSEETKTFVESAFRDGVRGRKQMESRLAAEKIPLPHRNQLNNFLAELKKAAFGPAKISLHDLDQFFAKHIEIPEDPDAPFVVNHSIDYTDDGNFRCFVSTRNLLKNAINREVLSADTTYKMTWEGFPLSPIGTTDQDRHFHLYGTLLSKTEATEDFEFAFQSIKSAVQMIHGYDMKPSVLICDAAGAIHNAAKSVFGISIFIRMCWFHMKRALKLYIAHLLMEKEVQNAILSDVSTLQLAQTPEIFLRASKLFLQKYKKYDAFTKYFDQVWLKEHPNWYEGCTSIPSPSTNNALESWNSLIKKEKSYRNRYPMNQFFDQFLRWHAQWSREYTCGAKKVIEIPTVDLNLLTKSYNWARLNKPLKSLTDESGSKYYNISAGNEVKPIDWSMINSWITFDQFKNRAFVGWKVIWEAVWQNSVCNCPAFMKNYICKHVVGIGIRKNIIAVPNEAKNVPLGQKRKRGRPSKARNALLVQ